MRSAVLSHIHSYMKKNKDVYFLTGDLGYTALEEIEKDCPGRFINVGIAEQNMMGIAAGLALAGKKVYVYSIIPFVTMRCYEQIRNDICYHDLDVTIIGVGGGLSYGILSSTHFALEDIAIFRPLPNMVIFSPADERDAVAGINYLKKYKHPTYFRIGKKIEPIIHDSEYEFAFDKPDVLKKGTDAVLLVTGPVANEALQAADELKRTRNISVSVINIHTLKPFNSAGLYALVKSFKFVFTLEEHYLSGGLGSAVAEMLAERSYHGNLMRLGIKDKFLHDIGPQDYLRKLHSLDSQGIQRIVRTRIKK